MLTNSVQGVVLCICKSFIQQSRFPVPIPEDDLGEVSRRSHFSCFGEHLTAVLCYKALGHLSCVPVRTLHARNPSQVEQVSQFASLSYQMAGR